MNELRAAIGAETAGILVEPIQGEGGIRAGDAEYLRELRELCDEHGILLLFDEVQCGMGRTGKLFAHEWAGITPDVMAIAKGIGGGFPLGACLATEKAAVGMTAGTHGSTYGGNPLAMAVGNAVLDVILADGFLEGVEQDRRAPAGQRWSSWSQRHPEVFDRGARRRPAARPQVRARRPATCWTRSAPSGLLDGHRGRERAPPAAAADRRRGRDRRGAAHPRKVAGKTGGAGAARERLDGGGGSDSAGKAAAALPRSRPARPRDAARHPGARPRASRQARAARSAAQAARRQDARA